MQPMNQQNVRSRTTGNVELRKLWNVPEGKYFWGLFVEYEEETCKMNGEGKHAVPDWSNIVKRDKGWNCPQGYVGDEDWAKRTAEHFEIDMPTEEYKGE